MRRTVAALLLLASYPIAPGAASADHCNKVYVFSRITSPGPTQVNPPAPSKLICLASGDHSVDTRALYPGADQVMLRYYATRAIGDDVRALDATLTGLGFGGARVRLDRSALLDGSCCPFDSAWVPIPAGPLARGCLTVTVVLLPDERTESQRARTPGTSC